MQFRQFDHARRTGAFAVVHLSIAVALGWLFTGSFLLAGLITLIEPALNTAAHGVFDGWWTRRHGPAPSWRKNAVFAAIHFTNAVAVAWALTGSLAVASALAAVEPLANAVALHFFDRWWSRRSTLRAAVA